MMAQSTGPDRVLQAYIAKYGQIPEQPNQLVAFSRTNVELPVIIYSEAKKAISKIKKSITTKKKKKSVKSLISPSTKWNVNDEVLISKDRTGIIRYIGKVPEMGDDIIYYGIELSLGTVGQHDGAIKGKRYFQTNGKRGMFIPKRKLRRKLNRKDRERRNSYHEISMQVKQLQKEYAGDDAPILYPSSQLIANQENINVNTTNNTHFANDNRDIMDVKDLHTLVFENPEHAYKYGNGGNQYQSATFEASTKNISPNISSSPHNNLKRKTKTKDFLRTRTGSSGSASSQSSTNNNNNNNNMHYRNDEDDVDDEDGTDQADRAESSDISDLEQEDSSPTVKTFDTLLKYILRQKGQYREGLLDVYANPQTHPLIVEAFSQMKQLKPNEQQFLWPALLRRWSKYTHRI